MTSSTVFLVGVGVTLVSAFLVVLYLRRYLDSVLADVCGTAERAHFWTAFSNIGLILVPTICALNYAPASQPIVQLTGQFQAALVGLAVAVLIIGLVLTIFIRREMRGSREARGRGLAIERSMDTGA
jgi:hypothetical protein